jgi:mRNA interferase RelE/StbE
LLRMNKYRITFARSARKELEELDAKIIVRVLQHIDGLATNPRPGGCRKLRGEKPLWRIRVSDYRVVYSVDDVSSLVDIIRIRHRKDVYS